MQLFYKVIFSNQNKKNKSNKFSKVNDLYSYITHSSNRNNENNSLNFKNLIVWKLNFRVVRLGKLSSFYSKNNKIGTIKWICTWYEFLFILSQRVANYSFWLWWRCVKVYTIKINLILFFPHFAVSHRYILPNYVDILI